MPTVKTTLPLTRNRLRLLSMLWTDRKATDPVYFAVEDGELIVSTEPLGDVPHSSVLASASDADEALRSPMRARVSDTP
jgi:hypothetical protein